MIISQNCTEEVLETSADLRGESPGGGISVGLWLPLGSASTGSVFYPDWKESVQVELQSADDSCNLFSDFEHLCNGFKKSSSFQLTGKVTPFSESLDLSWWSIGLTIGIRDAQNRKVIFNASPLESDDRFLRHYSYYYNDFAPRVGHALALMNDPVNGKSALWMVGGLVVDKDCKTSFCRQFSGLQTKGEVWKSDDGLHWVLLKENSVISSFRHTLTAMPDPNNNFQMTLWKIGGVSASPYGMTTLNTVSKSIDGIHWETCTAPFAPRAGHSTVVMPDINNGNKITLWVIGGYNANNETLTDVWKSVDGCLWTQVLPTLNLFATNKGAYGFQVGVFEDPNNGMVPTMWLTGGQDYLNNFYNNIWKSVDGINWQYVKVKTSIFSGRSEFQIFTMNDPENNNAKTMYVLGGKDGGGQYLGDLWKSPDGIHWFGTDISFELGWAGIAGHKAIVVNETNKELDGNLYIVGTTFDGGIGTNTLLKSNDLRKFQIGLTLPGWQGGNLTEFK